jgi:hypothetical protein
MVAASIRQTTPLTRTAYLNAGFLEDAGIAAFVFNKSVLLGQRLNF